MSVEPAQPQVPNVGKTNAFPSTLMLPACENNPRRSARLTYTRALDKKQGFSHEALELCSAAQTLEDNEQLQRYV